jgi:hypothetical protein
VFEAGGQAALGQDEHQGTESQRLGETRVVEAHADPRLAQHEPETEEDQQTGQPHPVRQPRGHDGRDHHDGTDQQQRVEVGGVHGSAPAPSARGPETSRSVHRVSPRAALTTVNS